MDRPDRRSLWIPLLLFALGIVAFGWNRGLKFVLWDEFLWYPDVLRVARESLPRGDFSTLLHPTGWQYPPLFFTVAGAAVRALGETFLSFRVVSIVSSALLAPWAFAMAREQAGGRAGLLAGYLAITLPLAHRFGGALLVDPFQAMLVGAALVLFVRAESRGTGLLPAAIVAALAGATKYTSLLLPAAITVVLAADLARRGSDEGRRRPKEVLLFAAVAFSPLLFLRPSDFELLRAMTFWRSLPFDWAGFARVVPPTLPLLALAAPLFRRTFPRAYRAPWLFVAVWMVFFFWRRQQFNWFLPVAAPLAALAAWTLVRATAGRFRLAVSIVAAATVLYGGARSVREIASYRERERIYTEASAYVNRRVPPEGVVVVDALPLTSPLYLQARVVDVRNTGYEEGRYALLVPWVHENFKIRGFSGSAWGDVHESAIRDHWVLEKEYADEGETVLRLFRNPRFERPREAPSSVP